MSYQHHHQIRVNLALSDTSTWNRWFWICGTESMSSYIRNFPTVECQTTHCPFNPPGWWPISYHYPWMQVHWSINALAGITGNWVAKLYLLPNQFQHEGAVVHFTAQTQQDLNTQFLDRWLGCGGPVSWPARQQNLNALNFFLWQHVKEVIYKDLPTDMDASTAKFHAAVAITDAYMLRCVQASIPQHVVGCWTLWKITVTTTILVMYLLCSVLTSTVCFSHVYPDMQTANSSYVCDSFVLLHLLMRVTCSFFVVIQSSVCLPLSLRVTANFFTTYDQCNSCLIWWFLLTMLYQERSLLENSFYIFVLFWSFMPIPIVIMHHFSHTLYNASLECYFFPDIKNCWS
jgi:hypothetical protein